MFPLNLFIVFVKEKCDQQEKKKKKLLLSPLIRKLSRPIQSSTMNCQEEQLQQAAKSNEEAQAVINHLKASLTQLEIRLKQVCLRCGIYNLRATSQ